MDSAVSTNLEPGTMLSNRYKIETTLGQGGMGAVYLGRIEALNKPVAIKEMRVQASDDKRQQQAIDQFRKEAHFLANLEHPNLVQVTDFFEENGRYYLVMAYVKGQNLSEVMQSKPGTMPVAQVLEWALQLTSVLGYLHTQEPPILFRDLKPSNIMLDTAGNIRLIDFGIARAFNPDEATATFLQGMGSAGYSPLEQYQGAGGTDPRSDIYALGATLFHLLTNKVPSSPVELVATGGTAIQAHMVNPNVPATLGKIVGKMMGLRKDERYQSMQQVHALLEQVATSLQEPEDATENLGMVAPSIAARSAPAPAPTPAPAVRPRTDSSSANSPVIVTTPLQDDSGGMALWLTAGTLCVAALSLFGWLFMQAQPQSSTTARAVTPTAQPTAAVASNPPDKAPVTTPVKTASKPPAPVTKPPVPVHQTPAHTVAAAPQSKPRPRPKPKPTSPRVEIPSLPSGPSLPGRSIPKRTRNSPARHRWQTFQRRSPRQLCQRFRKVCPKGRLRWPLECKVKSIQEPRAGGTIILGILDRLAPTGCKMTKAVGTPRRALPCPLPVCRPLLSAAPT